MTAQTPRTAIITGAATGIGAGVAKSLAAQGHRLALWDVKADIVHALAKEITAGGGQAEAFEVDVSNRAAVTAAAEATRAALGPIGIIVTSAGIARFTPLLEIEPAEWDLILAVNLTGTFDCIRAVVPDMLEAGWGRIVTISSSSAQSGTRNMAHYVASKGGVISLTKALALELAGNGITANTIPPTLVDTPMVEEWTTAGKFPGAAAVAQAIPVKRAGLPSDIGAAAAFLCSEEASYITGQVIGVNGGMYI